MWKTTQGVFAALALCAPLAWAQDGGGHPPVPLPGQQSEAQREMIELFGKVERQLRRIDELLNDAGSGNTRALAEVGESGIDQLLRGSLETGRETLQDIDRILELAQQMGGGQGGGSGQPQQGQQSQGGDPKQERGQERGGREQTPEQPGGQQPQESQESQQEGQGEPKSPREQDDPQATNEEGDAPPADETGEGARPSQAGERWGDLPVHVREIFTTEGDRHMPARYRDWIDSYYRKLARRGERR